MLITFLTYCIKENILYFLSEYRNYVLYVKLCTYILSTIIINNFIFLLGIFFITIFFFVFGIAIANKQLPINIPH